MTFCLILNKQYLPAAWGRREGRERERVRKGEERKSGRRERKRMGRERWDWGERGWCGEGVPDSSSSGSSVGERQLQRQDHCAQSRPGLELGSQVLSRKRVRAMVQGFTLEKGS